MMRKKTVMIFPWLDHDHILPFLELAKKLSTTNLFSIYFCSTPVNLDLIKQTLRNEGFSRSIQLIHLHLPELPGLPSHLHTTIGLPDHLMPTLKLAFDMAKPQFAELLEILNPDLLVYDLIQPWAPEVAVALGIPSVVFITTSVAASMYHYHLNTSKDKLFPFSNTIYHRNYEYVKIANNRSDKEEDRVMECVARSSNIVLVKSFNEIEGKYSDYLSVLTNKIVVPVGPLVAEPIYPELKHNNVIQWLDTKPPRSTVFVSFGSKYFLSSDDLEAIAYGLEMSNVNFVWVLRFPNDPKRKLKMLEAFPYRFRERVRNRGLLVEDAAPQTEIFAHKSIAGFVSHCGWNSVLEAMKFGIPIIAIPMHLDQPINARLVVEIGIGLEVVRDEIGLLRWEKVAETVQLVVAQKFGVIVRGNARSLSACLRLKGDEEINVVVDELLQLCKSSVARRVGGGNCGWDELRKTKSESFPKPQIFSGDGDFYRDRSKLLYAEENAEEEVSIDERAERFIKNFYDRTQMFIEEEEEYRLEEEYHEEEKYRGEEEYREEEEYHEEEEVSIDERAQWFIEKFYKGLRVSSSAEDLALDEDISALPSLSLCGGGFKPVDYSANVSKTLVNKKKKKTFINFLLKIFLT